jgi:putative transcriptional regulator
MSHALLTLALATLAFAGAQRHAGAAEVVSPDRGDTLVPCRAQPKLDKGMLLVAGEGLPDPNFSQTVVLLLAYGRGGSMGVVINRPSDVKLATVFPGMKQLRKRDDTLYVGGPVARDHVLLLIRSPTTLEGARAIFDGVYASSSMAVLRQQLGRPGAPRSMHAYAGHAGWAAGQLEAEVARGDWYVTSADADVVFSKAPDALWRTLLQRVEGDWVQREECGRGAG